MSYGSNFSVQVAVAATGTWVQSLPAELREWIFANARSGSLHAGQRLFSRSDAPNGIYCVTEGTIRISGIREGGEEALLAILQPPQWFGEIALFDDEPRTHDAWAESDAELLHVSQESLQERLLASPVDWRHFGRLLTQKMRLMFTGLEEIALLSPKARVAGRLAVMAAGYGAWSGRSLRVLKVSQDQLAQMLSLSRQTVNHSLKELELAGSIRRSRGSIEVLDLVRLSGVEVDM